MDRLATSRRRSILGDFLALATKHFSRPTIPLLLLQQTLVRPSTILASGWSDQAYQRFNRGTVSQESASGFKPGTWAGEREREEGEEGGKCTDPVAARCGSPIEPHLYSQPEAGPQLLIWILSPSAVCDSMCLGKVHVKALKGSSGKYMITRSLGALRFPTSRLQPLGPAW